MENLGGLTDSRTRMTSRAERTVRWLVQERAMGGQVSVPSGVCKLSRAQQESEIMDRGVAIILGFGCGSPQLTHVPLVVISSYLLGHSELMP
ncbi:hypothetical protein E2C01_016656 [Portunus trituberculatus]|uniref:Uncharacterized protein n=1 Tax=Portunus trituberculatus TaxID=210409 RepID=A0A5B7DQ18_PORTR|nr:hypothetical protein [Portunus trituberculatus]